MYIVIARGDKYEDCSYDQDWEANLFCTPDEGLAQSVIKWLISSKEIYINETKKYKIKKDEFLERWEEENPRPESIDLPRPAKPIHPIPHPSLKGLKRKEKKDNTYHKVYLEELRLFEKSSYEYNESCKDARTREEAPFNEWWKNRRRIEEEFRENNFQPKNFLPGWQEKTSKFETYFATGVSFFYQELEVFLPQQ